MRVDQANPVAVEASEVYFLDCVVRNGFEVTRRIEIVIDRVDVNIIDVEQDATAAASTDLGDEVPLRYRRVHELQIAGDVFDQYLAAQEGLRLVDSNTYVPQRML